MAKDLKQIKMRIHAVNQTLSITQAMYTTSVSKLSRATQNYNNYESFYEKFVQIFSDISYIAESVFVRPRHKNIKPKSIYFIITSDKGLCGGYHNDIFKEFKNMTQGLDKDSYQMVVIGRKGYSYYHDKNYPLLNKGFISNRDDINIIDYKEVCKLVLNLYKQEVVRDVYVVYNHSLNTMTRKTIFKKILPIENYFLPRSSTEYIYDDRPDDVFDDLVGIYIENQIFGAISDAKLSEHQARMMAMKSASDNAKKVLEKLSIIYNNARQEQITEELIDIVNASRRGK